MKTVITIIIVLVIALGADAITGFSSVTSSSATSTNSCTSANGFCGPVVFDQAIVANSSSGAAGIMTLSSPQFTSTLNETMIIASQCYASCNTTKVTDSQNNPFHKIAESNAQSVDILDGFWTLTQSGLDIVTVVWNASNFNFFEIALYKNANGVGQSSVIDSSTKTSLTVTRSGDWILGLGGTGNVIGNNICQALKPLQTNFVVRVNSCTFVLPSGPTSAFISDNATALPNNTVMPFQVTTNNGLGCGGGAVPCEGMEAELLAVDTEPQTPLPFRLNYAGTNTKANALNQVLAPSTTYCTGLTSNGITISTIGTIILEAKGSYGGVSLNTTGMKLNVQVQISTTVPQTTFGTGCSSVQTVATIVFTTSGPLGAANSYVASLAYQQTFSNIATTSYYAFVVIFTTGFTGHANFDQVLNQVYSFGTISILQTQ